MIKNLVRVCEMLGGWYPALSTSRRTVYDNYLSTFFYFQGDRLELISLRFCHIINVAPAGLSDNVLPCCLV